MCYIKAVQASVGLIRTKTNRTNDKTSKIIKLRNTKANGRHTEYHTMSHRRNHPPSVNPRVYVQVCMYVCRVRRQWWVIVWTCRKRLRKDRKEGEDLGNLGEESKENLRYVRITGVRDGRRGEDA